MYVCMYICRYNDVDDEHRATNIMFICDELFNNVQVKNAGVSL